MAHRPLRSRLADRASIAACALLGGLSMLSFAGLGGSEASSSARADQALAAAATALQNQDFRGAVTLLEPEMQALQNQAVAWRTLGLAHLRLHESSAARDAYLKALALEPNDPRLLLYLGVAAAQDGHLEQAFEWLRKAKESRRVDIWQLDIEPDLQALRGDGRSIRMDRARHRRCRR